LAKIPKEIFTQRNSTRAGEVKYAVPALTKRPIATGSADIFFRIPIATLSAYNDWTLAKG
jgi:hypothetical protein